MIACYERLPRRPNGAFCTRREMLVRSGMGLGMLGLASLFREAQASTAQFENPLSPKAPHFPAKAKHIIHVFLNGGPSHVDTFDPKPILEKYAGKTLPNENLRTERKTGAAFPSPFKFKKYGQSGIEISDIFAPLGKHADDLCVIRSMHADVPNHEPSLMLMNCGDPTLPRPSVGSWITYGLGTENQNLPAFVVLCPRGYPIKDTENWQSAFLPGSYQGTYVDTQFTQVDKLIANIRNRTITSKGQRRQLDFIQAMNRHHAERRQNESALQARIQSFELAYRMQMEATDAFDVEREPKHVQEAYGFNTEARQLLIARRLVERGVRYVQVWHGQGQPWDSHDDLRERHSDLAGQISKALTRLAHRSQRETPARRNARHLRRRIRPHADRRTAAKGRELRQDQRPRPQPLRLHRVDGGRRLQGRLYSWGDRRMRFPGRGKESARARPARHHVALDGPRSQTAHLPLCRPRLPADGRARQHRARTVGLKTIRT